MPDNKNTRRKAVDARVKDDICNAAMNLLRRRKSGDFTMALVAKETGMTRANLYKYFENKAVLNAYIIDKLNQPYDEQDDTIMDSDLPPMEKLRRLIELDMRVASENSEILRIMLGNMSHEFLLKHTTEVARKQQKRLVQIFEDGLRLGIFRDFSISDLITVYAAIINGFANRRLMGGSKNTAAEDAQKALDLFAHGACT